MILDPSIVISVLAFVVSVVSTVVAIKAWHRNRTVYGVELALLFRHPKSDVNNNNRLLQRLNSGKYTILAVHKYGHDLEVVLGRIKK